jgi:hypothetical protein
MLHYAQTWLPEAAMKVALLSDCQNVAPSRGGHGAARIGRHPMTATKDRQWIWNGRPASKLTGEEFLWNEAVIPMHKTRSSD